MTPGLHAADQKPAAEKRPSPPDASAAPPPAPASPRSPLRGASFSWLLFSVIALAGVGLWALSVTGKLTNDEQRALVPTSTVWGMHACLIAIAAGLGGIASKLWPLLGRRRAYTALALLLGGYAVCSLAPRTNRIFFDEHIYMQIGQTIAHTGRAEGADYARVEYGQFEMYNPRTNKQPNGLPYLLSWVYRIVGVSDDASHFLDRALTGLAAASIYLALTLVPWTLPIGTALAAAILFLFTPLVLWWGHTVAVEPAAAATTAFCFLIACIHARLRNRETAQGFPASALALAGATAFAVYFRPESLLVFPLVAAVLWSTDDRFIEDISAWGALIFAVALAMPNLLHIWSVRTEDWGARDGRRFASEFFGKNLASNAGYFVDAKWFPAAGTVLAICGALWLLRRNRTAGFALTLWFLISWGIFVLFYAGGYYYGASSRYGVISCAPVAIFMGIGLAALGGLLWRRPIILGALAAIGVVNWAAAMHYVPTLSREAVEAQADVDFVADIAKKIPDGALVISYDPCMWLLQGRNSTQFDIIDHMMREELRELAHQYPGGVYVHWGFWHNAEPHLAAATAPYLAATHAVEIARLPSQAYKLALFRVDTPEGFARFGGKGTEISRPDSDLDLLLKRAAAEPAPAK